MTKQKSPHTTDLNTKSHWIFDMDGTLTNAIHDFDAIKQALDLPLGKPILESLALLPKAIAEQKHKLLDQIELDIAKQSTAAIGAIDLLELLQRSDCTFGILTRNNKPNIAATLEAAGLLQYFPSEYWVSRHCADPKPSPNGIYKLIEQWQIDSNQAVMVGDSSFDLNAGKAAGITTVYIDPQGVFEFRKLADHSMRQLTFLLQVLKTPSL